MNGLLFLRSPLSTALPSLIETRITFGLKVYITPLPGYRLQRFSCRFCIDPEVSGVIFRIPGNICHVVLNSVS